MNLNHTKEVRNTERRRKRVIIPIVYFLVEVVFLWIVLAFIQGGYNIFEWLFWANGVFVFGIIYSVLKTINVYQRQKDYLTEKEYKESE